MTKEEFEKAYIEASGMSEELYHETQVTLPCTRCDDDECNGWAAVSNSPLTIKAHNALYR